MVIYIGELLKKSLLRKITYMENRNSYNLAQQELSSNLVLPILTTFLCATPIDVTGQPRDPIHGSAHSSKESW